MSGTGLPGLLGPPDRQRTVLRGEQVFRRGAPAEAVYSIRRGRVRLERSLEDGSVLVLGVLSAGDGLAEASLGAKVYHCDALAEVETRLDVYDRATLETRLGDDPDLARRWLERTARQVRDLRALLELRAVRPLTARILAWLRLRDDLLGGPGDRPLRALADDLGVRPEALYRALAELDASGEVRREGRRLVLTERSAASSSEKC